MRALYPTAAFALVLALVACESSHFGSSNGKAGKAKKDQGTSAGCQDGTVTIKVGESTDPAASTKCGLENAKKAESDYTDIAEVGPDGRVVGKKPGETDVTVVYDDGSTSVVHVTVTDDSDPGKTGDEGDDKKPEGLGETDDTADGCTIQGDKILHPGRVHDDSRGDVLRLRLERHRLGRPRHRLELHSRLGQRPPEADLLRRTRRFERRRQQKDRGLAVRDAAQRSQKRQMQPRHRSGHCHRLFHRNEARPDALVRSG